MSPARWIREHLVPVSGSPRRRMWTPLALLILGVLSVVMLMWTLGVSERRTAQDLAIVRTIDELQIAVAYWHLWLEEYLTEDPYVVLDRDVRDNQDLAIRRAGNLLDGGRTILGEEIRPLDDPRLRQQAETLAAALTQFRNLSEERLRRPREESGIGTPLDQNFDDQFHEVRAYSETLRQSLEETLEQNRAAFRLRVWIVVTAWMSIVTAAVFGLWRLEKHGRQAEESLRQREAELQQAQKMEAVGRLAGGIAHDVNNYLGAIRGYCEVAVIKGESGEALAERMDAAVTTADKISTLIRQLLAFSRRQPVQPEVVDLNRVVTDLEDLMKRLLGEDVALALDLEPELWPIEIDLSQIEQTLVNLLVNARDAMPQGGTITIESGNADLDATFLEPHPVSTPGHFVHLAVADTGCGIPPEARDEIFDPFFTTKAESGSSGLGLATVYAIVHQSGGFITLDSEVGQGTRFEIYLPASDAVPVARRQASPAPPAITGPARVLLVEDNEDMRASTLALLDTLGHDVRVAGDGKEALEMLGRGDHAFDLLITDVIMPGLSGKELFDQIRERHGELRCLFISGYTDNIMLRHGVRQDRVHFLQKPFSFDGLARKIAEVLESPGGDPLSTT